MIPYTPLLIVGTTLRQSVFRLSPIKLWLSVDQISIEIEFGTRLIWERMYEKRMSRVKFEQPDASVFREEDWPKMIDFMKVYVHKFESAVKTPIQQLARRWPNLSSCAILYPSRKQFHNQLIIPIFKQQSFIKQRS